MRLTSTVILRFTMVLLFLAGCHRESTTLKDDKVTPQAKGESSTFTDDTLATCEYFPLKVGTTWQYNLSDSVTVVRTVTKHEMSDGKPVALTQMTKDGSKFTTAWASTYSVDKNGVYFHSVSGIVCKPGVCYLKLPLTPGETWTALTKVDKEELRYNFSSGNEEEVVVPAGKFKAIPIKFTMDDGNNKMERIEWFAKEVGLVKAIQKLQSTVVNTLELEKFTPAK